MSKDRDRQQENLEIVREGVDAFQRGELEGLLALARDDFEVYVPQSLPNAGRYVGSDEFIAWLDQWLDAWEDFSVEITETTPVGARHVVAVVHQSGRGKGSGIPVDMEAAYLWEVREGRLAAMHLYVSREEALRVAEQREGAAGD
jgi:ketosteroid isomerase-like protein